LWKRGPKIQLRESAKGDVAEDVASNTRYLKAH
jgi:hypothetical protein